jgi:hypothetical protein
VPGGVTGATGSFTYLSGSNILSAQGGVTGATGSFTYLSGSNTLSAQGGVTGTTGSFTYLSASQNVISNIGSLNYLAVGPNAYVNSSPNVLDVSGNVLIIGNVSATAFASSSDYRIKENITALDNSFIIDNLRPVTYFNTLINKQDIGLIAHELQEIYPFLVTGVKDGPEIQSVNYIGLFGILVKEIQYLKREISNLKSTLVKD